MLTKRVSPLYRDEVEMDLMLADMKNSILTLKPTIILLKVLTPCYPIHMKRWLWFTEIRV